MYIFAKMYSIYVCFMYLIYSDINTSFAKRKIFEDNVFRMIKKAYTFVALLQPI